MNQIVSHYLSKLEFGDSKVFNNMGVIPLFTSVDDSPKYLTLKEVLERRLLVVTVNRIIPMVSAISCLVLCLAAC